MGWTGLDQRKFPRVKVGCKIQIDDSGSGSIEAQTENLSAGGVCTILERPLEKLSHVGIRVMLHPFDAPIECRGQVVWIVRSKDPATKRVTFDTGISFMGLRTEDEMRIDAFIRSKG